MKAAETQLAVRRELEETKAALLVERGLVSNLEEALRVSHLKQAECERLLKEMGLALKEYQAAESTLDSKIQAQLDVKERQRLEATPCVAERCSPAEYTDDNTCFRRR